MHADVRPDPVCSAPVAVAFTVATVVSFAAMGAAVTAYIIRRVLGVTE